MADWSVSVSVTLKCGTRRAFFQARLLNNTRTVWPGTTKFGRITRGGHISKGSVTPLLLGGGTQMQPNPTLWHRTTKFDVVTHMDGWHLFDLYFADDIALIGDSFSSVQETMSKEEESSKIDLVINPDKCKVTVTSTWMTDRISRQQDRILIWSMTYATLAATYCTPGAVKEMSRCTLEKQHQYFQKWKRFGETTTSAWKLWQDSLSPF